MSQCTILIIYWCSCFQIVNTVYWYLHCLYAYGVGGSLCPCISVTAIQLGIKTTPLSPPPLPISPFYTIDKYTEVVLFIFLIIKFCGFIKNQFWRYTAAYFLTLMNIWICGSIVSIKESTKIDTRQILKKAHYTVPLHPG